MEKQKFGLTKKHWFGYMCGDWGGCMTFTLMSTIFSMFCTNALAKYSKAKATFGKNYVRDLGIAPWVPWSL